MARSEALTSWLLAACVLVLVCAGATSRRSAAQPSVVLRKSGDTRFVAAVTGSRLSVLRLPGQSGSLTGNLLRDGKSYGIVEQHAWSCNSRHRSLEQLLSRACHLGPQCLMFEGFPAPDGCGSDRIEVRVSSAAQPSALTLGETRYLRFFLKVDPAFRDFRTAPLIAQVWQASSVAVGQRPALGPAFAISIMGSRKDPSRVGVDFRYRNEVSAANPPHPFLSKSIPTGSWHDFQVELTPRQPGHARGLGTILVWFDEGLSAALEPQRALNYNATNDSSYRFAWGYAPDPDTRLGDRFDVRVGIYRPEPLGQIKFWMDGVKLVEDKADLLGP